MLRAAFLLVAATAPVAVNPAAMAEGGERNADRDFILRAEHALSQAYVRGVDRDVAALLSDDFRGIGSRGEVSDKTETLTAIRAGGDESRAEIESLDVQVKGDTAIARIREKDIGVAPDFAPMWRVITDTWVKTAGQWQLLAAEELDPGAPTVPAYQAAIGEIKALRAASNRAIAAHDMDAFLPIFADDAAFVFSNGSSAKSRSELQAAFAKDFADPAFVTYVRSPDSVSISDAGVRAVEHGTWTAIKREPRGETRYGGDYVAHWFESPQGWQIRGELYVKLRCAGPLCSP
jgi:uncharacterized protein (TIGR02246 family)